MSVLLFAETLKFRPGQEAHTDPFHLTKGAGIHIRCKGGMGLYVGVFGERYYQSVVARSPGTFPFPFATDRRFFDGAFRAPNSGMYRIVLRAAALNLAGEIKFQVELLGASELPRDCAVAAGTPA